MNTKDYFLKNDEELEKFLKKHPKKNIDVDIENWLTPEDLKIVRKLDKVLIEEKEVEDVFKSF